MLCETRGQGALGEGNLSAMPVLGIVESVLGENKNNVAARGIKRVLTDDRAEHGGGAVEHDRDDRGAEASRQKCDEKEASEADETVWGDLASQCKAAGGLLGDSKPCEAQAGGEDSIGCGMVMGGRRAVRRTTDATDEDDDRADQRGTDWVAEDCDDDVRVDAGHTRADVRARVSIAQCGREGAQSAEEKGCWESNHHDLHGWKRQARTIVSDSESGCDGVAGSQERHEGSWGEEDLLGSDRATDDARQGGGTCGQVAPRGQLDCTGELSNGEDACNQIAQGKGASSSKGRKRSRAGGVHGSGGSIAGIEAGSRGSRHVLSWDGHEAVGLQCDQTGMDGEHCGGLHAGVAREDVEDCQEGDRQRNRVEGQDQTGIRMGISSMPHILSGAGHQCMEDVQLQGSSQTWQATSGRQHEVFEGGSEIRQAGPASPHHICMGRITEGGLGDGESSGLPSLQAIHEAYEGEACEAPSQLLRIRGMVQETHTHLDEHKVATQGSHRIGQVRQQVSEWGHGSAWKVEAQVRDSTAELASSEWAREGVHEVGSPSDDSQGDDSSASELAVKTGMKRCEVRRRSAAQNNASLDAHSDKKRPRQLESRLGKRRRRNIVISSEEEEDKEEELEWLNRGAVTVDCKRVCENTHVT